MVKANEFRQDLYYRINVINIEIIPLRHRREDIPVLAEYLLDKIQAETDQALKLDKNALSLLQEYRFPGNIRELENILERACAMAEGNTILEQDLNLPPHEQEHTDTSSLTEKTAKIEASALQKALEQNRWNQSATARQLGITLRQLRYRCEKWV